MANPDQRSRALLAARCPELCGNRASGVEVTAHSADLGVEGSLGDNSVTITYAGDGSYTVRDPAGASGDCESLDAETIRCYGGTTSITYQAHGGGDDVSIDTPLFTERP